MDKNEKKNALENALAGLKKLVFGDEKEAKAIKTQIKYKFEIVEDTKGQTIQYPELVVNAPVTIGDAEGGEVAPDGLYQIDEKTSIEVKNGVIAVINAPEEVAEELAEDKAEETNENSEVAEQVIEVVDAVKDEITSLQEEVKVLKDAVAEFSKMDKNVTALTDAFAKFSKEPIEKSVTKTEGIMKDKNAELADFIASKRKK